VLIRNYLHSPLIMAGMCDHLREFMMGHRAQPGQAEGEHRPLGHYGHGLSPVTTYDKAAAVTRGRQASDDVCTNAQAG
jgi:hypothetical protein